MKNETLNTNQSCNSLFYEKPEERSIEGIMEFMKNGQKYTERTVYSKPCERCAGCPVYRIDRSVEPTAYYCQAGFLFGAFNRAIEEDTIPKNCRVVEVRVASLSG